MNVSHLRHSYKVICTFIVDKIGEKHRVVNSQHGWHLHLLTIMTDRELFLFGSKLLIHKTYNELVGTNSIFCNTHSNDNIANNISFSNMPPLSRLYSLALCSFIPWSIHHHFFFTTAPQLQFHIQFHHPSENILSDNIFFHRSLYCARIHHEWAITLFYRMCIYVYLDTRFYILEINCLQFGSCSHLVNG